MCSAAALTLRCPCVVLGLRLCCTQAISDMTPPLVTSFYLRLVCRLTFDGNYPIRFVWRAKQESDGEGDRGVRT